MYFSVFESILVYLNIFESIYSMFETILNVLKIYLMVYFDVFIVYLYAFEYI
jgi:hypothetical protein